MISLYFVYMKKPEHRLDGRVCYVGITQSFERRVKTHLRAAQTGGHKYRALQQAIARHGEACFDFVEVAICRNRDDACAAEITAIVEQGTLWDVGGYNLSYGGDGGRVSRASAEKISRNKKALYSDPYERARTAVAVRESEAHLRDVALRSARAKEIQNRPEVKAKQAVARAQSENRARWRKRHAAAMASPEYRERQRAISLEIANRPGERQARRERSKESQNRPDVRSRKSIGAKAAWAADDGTRRAIVAQTARRPDVRAKKSAMMRARQAAKAAAVTDAPESLQTKESWYHEGRRSNGRALGARTR